MGFTYNSATGKFEKTGGGGQQLTDAQKNDSALKRAASSAGISPQQVLYGTDKQSVAARKTYEKIKANQAGSSTPYGTAKGSAGEMSLAKGAGGGERQWIGRTGPSTPTEPVVPVTGQPAIDAAWAALYDEAAVYRQTYGEEPPSAWWSARTSQIESMQKRYDAADKASAASSAAAAKAKAEAEAKELERQRKIKGGREAEAFLRQQADTRKADMLKRVAELYDPLKTKTDEDLARTLQAASDAYDAAEGQVRAAGEDFTKGFTPSKAYSEIPLSTYTTAENPLLAALQQQGAGTGEVSAATEAANQFMAQQSALEKWAAGQLNVGQQNYDTAVQQAARGGLAAALQGLAGRRADVKTGIQQQFADALSKIEQERTAATSDVDKTIAEIIAEADKTRAETTAEYGNLPKENQAAQVAAKKKKGAAAIAGIKANIEGR